MVIMYFMYFSGFIYIIMHTVVLGYKISLLKFSFPFDYQCF